MPKKKDKAKELLPDRWSVMKEMDEELYRKVTDWRQCLYNNEVIPAKYKELMKVAMRCVIRASGGIKTHGQNAMDLGATKEELFATIAQSMLIGGLPGWREGMTTLQEFFK